MSHRNTFFFTLAAVLSLLFACSPQPEAPAPETALTAPPELTVTAGNQSCTALRGGWSWTVREGNDQYSGTISDSVPSEDTGGFLSLHSSDAFEGL